MRSLHTVESKLYAPEMTLTGGEYKTILYIRHNSIRWDKEEFQFSYGEISKAIGLQERYVKKVIKNLVKKGLLCLIHKKIKNVHQINSIGLSQKYFGSVIEESCRPKFTVHQGGKLSTVVSSETLPPVSHEPPPVVPTETLPSCPIEHPEQGEFPPPSPLTRGLKNPLKEQDKKILKNVPDLEKSFTLSGDGAEYASKETIDKYMANFRRVPK